MAEPRIIYVVGSGEYSYFGIDAVFSTEELAKEFAAKLEETGERASIETLELDAKKNLTVRTEWHADAGNLFGAKSPHYYEHKHLYPNPCKYEDPEECDACTHRIQFVEDYRTGLCGSVRVYSYVSAEHAKQVLEENMHHLGRRVEEKLVCVPRG